MGADEKKSKNRPKFIRFDPSYVGWDVGLDKAIEDAQRMHVPLAVESIEHLDRVKKKFPDANVILVKDNKI